MLGESWRLLDSAKRISVIGRKRVHCALVTSSHVGHDYSSLPLEALSASIDQESRDVFFALSNFSRVIDLVHH